MRVRSMTSALVRRSIPLIASFIACTSVANAAEPVPLSPPAQTALPDGPLGDSVRYGQSLVTNTRALAAGFVGNGLTCANCHLAAGRVAYAAPLAGLWGVFPEYRARRGSVESLSERINDCFTRSMNGKPLPSESREMIALLSYIAWLSEGVPTGVEVQGRGFKEITAPSTPNPVRGESLYVAKCAACHGADGQGLPGADNAYAFPPLWGAQSFNTGAGMARVSVAAAFVQAKMPLGSAGTLSDQEAYDIAAYFTSKPRPDFAARKNDWPRGGAPADARK
jgi:thiosulfate dehydrogenase